MTYYYGINQVTPSSRGKELNEDEIHQCRAVLGAAQWRVYQTGPHHAAKLSHLQSMLPRESSQIINDIKKFVREVHGQRDLGLKIHQLAASCDEDLAVVAWSDASLANRSDLSSTGGMMIGFVHREIIRGPVNLISWGSSRLKRVCRSSLAAETQAMAEAEQELMFIRAQWRFVQNQNVPRTTRPNKTSTRLCINPVLLGMSGVFLNQWDFQGPPIMGPLGGSFFESLKIWE